MPSHLLTSGMLTACSPTIDIQYMLAVHIELCLLYWLFLSTLNPSFCQTCLLLSLLNEESAQSQDLECLLLSCMTTLLASGLQGSNDVHMIDKHFWGPLGTAEAQQRKSAVSISTAWSCSGTGHKVSGPAYRVHICLGAHAWMVTFGGRKLRPTPLTRPGTDPVFQTQHPSITRSFKKGAH